MVRDDVSGYLLAGGESRRFGSDKARAELHGRPLILHAADVVSAFCHDVTVVAAPECTYEDLGLTTIPDLVAGRGPLSGLHAALFDAESDFVALAACDFVGADPQWLERLYECAQPGKAAAFRDSERWHPVFAIYSIQLLAEVRRRLDAEELSVQKLLDLVGVAVPVPPDFARARSIDTTHALTDYRRDE